MKEVAVRLNLHFIHLYIVIICCFSYIFLKPSFGVENKEPAHIICNEAVWCSIASEIGGPLVKTEILIEREGLDPHHFRPPPSFGRKIAQADMVIMNGAAYDDWAAPMVPSSVKLLNVASLTHWQEGDDPHLFFSPEAVAGVGQEFSSWLVNHYPDKKGEIMRRQTILGYQVTQIKARLANFKMTDPAVSIAVLEPAGMRLMMAAGFHIIDPHWAQVAMEGNGTSPRETAALIDAIDMKKIRFLVVNPTVQSSIMTTLIDKAQKLDIPIISIGETLPFGQNWFFWMSHILDDVTIALRRTQKAVLFH